MQSPKLSVLALAGLVPLLITVAAHLSAAPAPGSSAADASGAAMPAADLPGAATQPARVLVNIHIISVGRFDVATGGFTVDFYLNLLHPRSVEPDFEFCNGRAASKEQISRIEDLDSGTVDVTWRIQASLTSPVDLRRFPFDTQEMQIVLEDKGEKNTLENLVYVPGQHDLDKGLSFTGWLFGQARAASAVHEYPMWNQKYSQYVFTMSIQRVKFNSFIKTFLPVFFIVLVLLCTYVMGTDKIAARLGMAGSSLVAAVMFHVSISNQIPPVGYLTFADKFMIVTYMVMLVTFLVNAVILYAQEHKREDIAKRISPLSGMSMVLVVPVAYALLFALAR